MGKRTLSLAIVVALASYVSLSFASTLRPPPSYIPIAILGGDAEGTLSRVTPLLRNQAFIEPIEISVGPSAIPLESIEGTPFLRPLELLDEGASIDFSGSFAPKGVRVGALIDELPPARPSLVHADYLRFYEREGCGGVPDHVSFEDSLPGALAIEFEGGEDDHAAWDALTYLIFIGETAEAASSAKESVLYLIAESEGRLADQEREASLMHALERARFIAIEAVDRAGNISERSAPIEFIHRLGIMN